MRKYTPLICLVILSGLTNHAFSREKSASQRDISTTQTNSREIHVNETDDAKRLQWHLTKTEWQRYKQLMQGIRGSISPKNISPIEVLGVHARNEKERQRYAEIWAKMRHDDAARILAFQYAYDRAFKKLYPNEMMIDVSKLKRPKSAMAGFNRILAFINIKNCPACERTIQTLVNRPDLNDKQLDIYFVDLGKVNQKNNRRIRKWAERLAIDRSRLKTGRITLNYNQGNLYKITRKLTNNLPMVFRANQQSIERLFL